MAYGLVRSPGIAPTGKEVTISGLSAAVLKDGKVIQHWEFSDDQGLLACSKPRPAAVVA